MSYLACSSWCGCAPRPAHRRETHEKRANQRKLQSRHEKPKVGARRCLGSRGNQLRCPSTVEPPPVPAASHQTTRQ